MKRLPKKLDVSSNGLSLVDMHLPGVIVATANTPEMATAIMHVWNNMGNTNTSQEGWANDVTAKNMRTHYYKDGVALCGKGVVKHFFKNFDKRDGSKYFHDCQSCINELKKLNDNGN